jgi:hypothetical protein
MSDLISDEYLEQLRLMRAEGHRPRWGNGGQRHVQVIRELIARHKPASLLDYGCGHGVLLAELAKHESLPMAGYDPGIPERAASPAPADLVVSTDVLEHIEPDKLMGVLTHIRFLTAKMAYINVHTGKANAVLPDGRNAHLIQKPADWWRDTLMAYFTTVKRVHGFDGFRPSFLCE